MIQKFSSGGIRLEKSLSWYVEVCPEKSCISILLSKDPVNKKCMYDKSDQDGSLPQRKWQMVFFYFDGKLVEQIYTGNRMELPRKQPEEDRWAHNKLCSPPPPAQPSQSIRFYGHGGLTPPPPATPLTGLYMAPKDSASLSTAASSSQGSWRNMTRNDIYICILYYERSMHTYYTS